MIDTAMLTAMREAIRDLLPDVCNVLTVTRTADGQGGMTEAWGTSLSLIPCRVDMKSNSEMLKGDSWRPYTGYMISLPYDTTITTNDRIEHSGETYAVTSVNTEQSWQAVKRCTLEVV